jgi:AcrR family transcriptional regulator
MRDEVIRTATRLFSEKGIRGVALQNIADELGMTKGALYHYFSSRDDLLRHVFGDWTTEEAEGLRKRIADSGTATEQLRDYVTYHVSSLVKNFDLYGLSFSSEAELPPDIRAEFRHRKRQSDTVLRDILQKGVTDGEFEARDEKVIAFAIDGMCNWMWKWYDPDGPKSADDIAEDFIELLTRGLLRSSDDDSPVRAAGGQTSRESAEYHARAIRFHSERLQEILPSLTSPEPVPVDGEH